MPDTSDFCSYFAVGFFFPLISPGNPMIFSRLENPTGHFSKHFEQAFETGGPPTFSESIPPISQVPPPPAPSDYIYGKDPRRVGVLFASCWGAEPPRPPLDAWAYCLPLLLGGGAAQTPPRRVGVLFASAAGGRSRPDPPSTRGRIVCLLLGGGAPSGRSNRQQPPCSFRPLSFLGLEWFGLPHFLQMTIRFSFQPPS